MRGIFRIFAVVLLVQAITNIASAQPNSNTLPPGWSSMAPTLSPSGPNNAPAPNLTSNILIVNIGGNYKVQAANQIIVGTGVIMSYKPSDGNYARKAVYTAPQANIPAGGASVLFEDGTLRFTPQLPSGSTIDFTYTITLLTNGSTGSTQMQTFRYTIE